MSERHSPVIPGSLPALSAAWRVDPDIIDVSAGGIFPALGTDAERWTIVAFADIPGSFLCSERPTPAMLQAGIPIPSSGLPLTLCYRDYGGWVQGDWVVFSPIPGLTVRIWAISWRP